MGSSDKLESFLTKMEPFLVIVIVTSFVGVVCGVLGAVFLKTINVFISFREAVYYVILLMPLIGLLIVYINKRFKCSSNGEKLINDAVTRNKDIPNYVTPVLFASTTLSHFVGAAVGKMEAPIKMGGGIGCYIAKFFNLNKEYRSTVIASGVAALFASVFGAPVTGTVFAYEICYSKDKKKPIYILPVLLAACFSRFVCFAFGLNSFVDQMLYIHHASFELKQIIPIIILIGICLVFALLFNVTFKYIRELFSKIKNEYVRVVIGSLIMIGAIYLIGNTLFCSNNTILVERALIDNSMWYSFILKTLLTALCLAVGFKGGNIGPAFIAGATLGILMASFMGLDPLMGAAIGAVCLFGSVTGCFVSAIALGIEIFGLSSIGFYLIIAIMIRYFVKNRIIERGF